MSVDPLPTLVVLGTEPAGESAGHGLEGLLADADTVFTFPRGPESVALFYAEAWRVERISPRDAVGRITAWAADHPAGNGVLLVAGEPAADVALGAVLDGLARTAPGLGIRVAAGTRVAPPHRSPLIG
ncbi:hypothetical protein GCM10009613_09760 [Pseudonocardia kongjuensis]|uniref:Uncharacterized protein n=1 Tax=Pseudonocardia kongjuensis TaxID=102227 RepID=A0ABN1XI09_9PSEU